MIAFKAYAFYSVEIRKKADEILDSLEKDWREEIKKEFKNISDIVYFINNEYYSRTNEEEPLIEFEDRWKRYENLELNNHRN